MASSPGQAHWRMIRRYADLMYQGRQNTFWIPLSQIFTLDENGVPVLNRVRLRRWVRTFTDAGLHYIEGGHFGGRTDGVWTAPTFIGLTKSLATSPEGNADIAVIAGQLMDEIDRNDWWGHWIQHVADEPIAANAVDYRIFVGMVRRYMPAMPILDATMQGRLWVPWTCGVRRCRLPAELRAFRAHAGAGRCRLVLYLLLSKAVLAQPPARHGTAAAGADRLSLGALQAGWFSALGLQPVPETAGSLRDERHPQLGRRQQLAASGDTHIVYPAPPKYGRAYASRRTAGGDYELRQLRSAIRKGAEPDAAGDPG